MHVYESRFNTQIDEPEKDVFPGICFNFKLYKTTQPSQNLEEYDLNSVMISFVLRILASQNSFHV